MNRRSVSLAETRPWKEQGHSRYARGRAIEVDEPAIEVKGRVIEVKDSSKGRRDKVIEVEGHFIEEICREISTEDASIEIIVTVIEVIDSFTSMIDAFISLIEQFTSIEETFTS
ncbi:MAG TPA: hypothetical protein VIY73_16745 [Polyangiaceae bacterium]